MGKKKHVFITEWKDKNLDLLKRSHPEYSDEQINAYLDKQIEKHLVNPRGQLVNNYVNKIVNVNLLDLIDWMDNVKPIIAGNGTFFKNQNQAYSPANKMLDEFLSNRSKYKDMLKIVEKNSYEYDTYDRLQKTEKISANSYYGGSGNEAFVFYNLFAAVAVTSTAQSLISTTETAFEAFLANNTPYINYDDCINFIQNVINDKTNLKSDFLDDISKEQLMDRLLNNFKEEPSNLIKENLSRYVDTLSHDQLNRLYYKNNIYEFSNLKKINGMLLDIISDTDEFKNSNKVPENIKERLDILWGYYDEFVFYNHFIYNRIQRLKYEKRKSVVVVDTDSNMIHLGPWVDFVNENVYDKYHIDKSEEDKLYISINIMSYFVTNMVNNILMTYTKKSNVLKEYRPRINMKNEFLYLRMILSKVKKRYIGSIRLREGEEFIPEKLDIKGHDFVKSSCTPEVKKYFETLVTEELLYNNNIDVGKILTKLKELESYIYDSLNKAEKKFFLPRQVKEMSEYKEPLSIQQFKATLIWNLIYPDIAVDLPSNVFLIKINLKGENMELLRSKYPDIYRKINSKITNSGVKGLCDKPIETIAIPSNIDEVPSWIIEFMDYQTMINDNVSKFYPVLESLGIPTIKAKGGATYFSNILDI